MNPFRKLRQYLCAHAVYYSDITPRNPIGDVYARCYKCGALLVADCGLHLNATLKRRPTPPTP